MAQARDIESRESVLIDWDPQDQIFVASLPGWGPYCKTHGATDEEAQRNAREVLNLLETTDN
jgi:antitoxin HicB